MRRCSDAYFAAMSEVRSILRPGIAVRDVLETISQSYKRASLRGAWSGDAGYSLGITVQEPPRVGPQGVEAVIEAGMVLALMPSLHRAGEATFHHSDVYAVTADGCDCLSEGLQELVIYD
jgi:Xaa-Pro aminopeptidase